MKATDRQLLDISEELTAYIMKPTFNLCLSPDECIILNRLICEEFERREEQDVMGSSNGQDTPLGQSGSDNTDVTLDASECRDNEASGTSLREKKKPQITKVSKKEYWDNRDKHGTYIETYFETCDMTDQPESHFGKEPYEEPEVPCLEQNYCKDCVHYSRLHHVDGMGECDHCSVTVWGDQLPCFGFERISSEDTNGNHNETTNENTEEITQLDDLKDTDVSTEIKVSKGAMSIDAYKLFGQSFDEKCFRFNGVPLLDKYIPVAWMRERIRANDDISDTPYADNYRKVIDSWEAFGKDSWYQNRHYDPSVYFETTD